MKRLILVVALLTMVAFVSGVMAQGKPAPAPAPAPEKQKEMKKEMKMQKFSGTVDKVDEAAKTIVVKSKKGDKTFMIDGMAKITKGGKEMPLADLKSGMNVSIEYKMDGDKMVATSIKAAAPKAAKGEKKEKAAPAPAPAKPAETPKK